MRARQLAVALVAMLASEPLRSRSMVAAERADDIFYLHGNVPARADWLGAYERQGASKRAKRGLIDGRSYYAKRGDRTRFMWYNKHSNRWYVGRARALGHAAGLLHVEDAAETPQQISNTWKVYIGPRKGWSEAPTQGGQLLVYKSPGCHVGDVRRAPFTLHLHS